MKAEIITIGDEILLGQIIDTNSAWIAQNLFSLQIHVHQITSITDTQNHILSALSAASERADLIICTGGLGPTKDDITKTAAAVYFNSEIIHNDMVMSHVQKIFQKLKKTMPDMNYSQADVLACSEVLFNDWGTAPGMWVEKDGKIFVFLPGVPFEMKNLMTDRVLPKLSHYAKEEKIVNRYILTVGIGESHLAEKIAKIEDAFPGYAHLAYLPKIGQVRLRLSLTGNNVDMLNQEADFLQNELINCIGRAVVAIKDISFEQVIVNEFKFNECTLSTAESCTGGNIAKQITEISGASHVFYGSIVAYANIIKEQLLNVDKSILELHGAVSEETVIQMAKGAQRKFDTTYAIATSGIAGPSGGSIEKPVGSVWIAIAGKNKVITKHFQFSDDRLLNIERTTVSALLLLWDLFFQEKGN